MLNRPSQTEIPRVPWTGEGLRCALAAPGVPIECLPTQIQVTRVMAVLDVLSSHNPDEEYIGDLPLESWDSEKVIDAAYEHFNSRLKEIEGIINAGNENTKLKNRCGVDIVPYELLKPFSKPRVTGMSVPNNISI